MGAVAKRFPVRVPAPAQRKGTLRDFVEIAHPVDEHGLVALDQIGPVFSHFDRHGHVGYPIFCIAARKSEFDFVFPSLSSNSSIASTCDSGLSTFLSTQMRFKSSRFSNSSSFRVPLFRMSMAGNTRLSTSLRSRWISMLPVPLNSSKMMSSMRDPVSTSAVAMMVSDPPSSMLRAAPKNRFGRCRALASTPPDSTFPEGGTIVLYARASRVIESRR